MAAPRGETAEPRDVLVVAEGTTAESLWLHFNEGVLPEGGVEMTMAEFEAMGRLPDCDCQLIQCACAVARLHDVSCVHRKALTCAIGVPCDEHHDEECPVCYPCTCGARSV